MSYVSIPVIILSFFIGLVFNYLLGPELKTIYIYPTPDNYTKNLYKDNADQCFEFQPQQVDCPLMPRSIPVQN